MRRNVGMAFALAAVLLAGSHASFADAPRISGSFLMGTGSATGNYYAFGSALTQVINRHTGANITVSSTGGSVENVRLLKKADIEFSLVQTDVNSYALNGVEQFADGAVTNFSAITACYPEMVQIVVSRASGIKNVADMRGKRVCVGAVGSGFEVAARQILSVYGMSYDDIDERFLSQSEAKNALQDDQIDAFFMCSGYPNANVTELSLTGRIDLVSIDEEHVKLLLEKYPFYAPFTTPDDTYKVGRPITSVAVMSMLVALNELDEKDVYAVTAAIYEHLDEVRAVNRRAEHMSLENPFRGIPGNVHPGAARYYEERGIEVPGR